MSSSTSILIEEKQVRINGLKINYKRIGGGNSPVILLHGWGISSDKYIETAKQFSAEAPEFGIFIPDLPGFGKSDDPPGAWGVDNYTDLVKKFADALNIEKFILIGHSFGGRIAIKFAGKYSGQVKALALTGAAGIKHPPAIKQKIFFVLAKAGKAVFSLPLLSHLEKTAKKILYKAAREKDYYKTQGIMRETFKKVIGEDLAPYLEKIKVPALLVWGRNDRSTPFKDGEIIHSRIRNSELAAVDEANHSLPYQYPGKFVKIVLEFIKKI